MSGPGQSKIPPFPRPINHPPVGSVKFPLRCSSPCHLRIPPRCIQVPLPFSSLFPNEKEMTCCQSRLFPIKFFHFLEYHRAPRPSLIQTPAPYHAPSRYSQVFFYSLIRFTVFPSLTFRPKPSLACPSSIVIFSSSPSIHFGQNKTFSSRYFANVIARSLSLGPALFQPFCGVALLPFFLSHPFSVFPLLFFFPFNVLRIRHHDKLHPKNYNL